MKINYDKIDEKAKTKGALGISDPVILAELDDIAGILEERTGMRTNRTNVLRHLIFSFYKEANNG